MLLSTLIRHSHFLVILHRRQTHENDKSSTPDRRYDLFDFAEFILGYEHLVNLILKVMTMTNARMHLSFVAFARSGTSDLARLKQLLVFKRDCTCSTANKSTLTASSPGIY